MISPATYDSYDDDYADIVTETILSRHSVSPKVLEAPGPSTDQLRTMIKAAASAPDHGLIRPWRFIDFPGRSRKMLADVFERALLERFSDADDEDRRRAREKAARAPTLLGLVAQIAEDEMRVTRDDQIASCGAALQNILLTAHAMGYGARAMSGRAVRTESFRSAIGLADNEEFLCFIAMGTPSRCGRERQRPEPETILSVWEGWSQ
ncbi:nitroreductase family protein [Coralliovum pocilloporae]|uniref:nitroreductase family protein n=1 Tax=Coralliovum pocilloporae TaxID=3066369 RepID=UPI0033075C62